MKNRTQFSSNSPQKLDFSYETLRLKILLVLEVHICHSTADVNATFERKMTNQIITRWIFSHNMTEKTLNFVSDLLHLKRRRDYWFL